MRKEGGVFTERGGFVMEWNGENGGVNSSVCKIYHVFSKFTSQTAASPVASCKMGPHTQLYKKNLVKFFTVRKSSRSESVMI